MTNMTFEPWPKIARLNRDITITEKIDGTNAAILIDRVGEPFERIPSPTLNATTVAVVDGIEYQIGAQSRNRIITPGKQTDNAGFAGWVAEHAEELVETLGAGRHFGEWWGKGINRGYGASRKLFSLFNVDKYKTLDPYDSPLIFDDETVLNTVPVLYRGPFSEFHIHEALYQLSEHGSKAAPLFKDPEGIIVFHHAARTMFKVTIKDDAQPKGLVATDG